MNLKITHNRDGYTIDCDSFYETCDCSEITNIDSLENLVEEITTRHFNGVFDVYATDGWHSGASIELVYNQDGDMPCDFELDKVSKLDDKWFEIYNEAYGFAQDNSNFLQEVAQ